MNRPGSLSYYQSKMKEVTASQMKQSSELPPPPVYVPPPQPEVVKLDPYPDEDPMVFPPVPITNPEGFLNPMSPSEIIVAPADLRPDYRGYYLLGAIALAVIVFAK